MSPVDAPQVLPSQEEMDLARAAIRGLSEAGLKLQPAGSSDRGPWVEFTLAAAPRGTRVVRLPRRAVQVLLQTLELTSQGHGAALMAHQAEMTTGEAADVLGVSRPHLVLLLERGEIPFHKVGSHRRVRCGDVLAFRDRLKTGRERAAGTPPSPS